MKIISFCLLNNLAHASVRGKCIKILLVGGELGRILMLVCVVKTVLAPKINMCCVVLDACAL